MEVSCKPVRGRDVQSLRSGNYLKEKKVKCIRFTVKSYMDLVADRYNSFVNAHFWEVGRFYFYCKNSDEICNSVN